MKKYISLYESKKTSRNDLLKINIGEWILGIKDKIEKMSGKKDFDYKYNLLLDVLKDSNSVNTYNKFAKRHGYTGLKGLVKTIWEEAPERQNKKAFEYKIKQLLDTEKKYNALWYKTSEDLEKKGKEEVHPEEVSKRLVSLNLKWHDVTEDIRENHTKEWLEWTKKNHKVSDYVLGDVIA